MINLYPKHSNKQRVQNKIGDTHILVLILLRLVRGHFMTFKDVFEENINLYSTYYIMRNKNSKNVNAKYKPFTCHSLCIRYIMCYKS